MGWHPMSEAPRTGEPIIVIDSDGSGELRVAFLVVNGVAAWWPVESDEAPSELPYTDADDTNWGGLWTRLPVSLLPRAMAYLIDQYGTDAIPIPKHP